MQAPRPRNAGRDALFSLVCMNKETEQIAAHHANAQHCYRNKNGRLAFDIGFNTVGDTRYTLATIGRGADVTIFVARFPVSRVQLSFEIHPDSGEFIIQDRSTTMSSRVWLPSGQKSKLVPFEERRLPRRVVTRPGLNEFLAFGGSKGMQFQFQIEWHKVLPSNWKQILAQKPCNPRRVRTLDQGQEEWRDTEGITRVQTPSVHTKSIRYLDHGRTLGKGAFGTVRQVLDIDSGTWMALKSQPCDKSVSLDQKIALNRELDLLKMARHSNVIEFLFWQTTDGDKILEIFTPVKEGNVRQLVDTHCANKRMDDEMAWNFMRQSLQALDFLASVNIVHRDIKPENILYEHDGQGLHFRISDFGLSILSRSSNDCAGTAVYSAPENRGRTPDKDDITTKIDVYSLYVTLVDVRDLPDGARRTILNATHERVHDRFVHEVSVFDDFYAQFSCMVRPDHKHRISAGDALTMLWGPQCSRATEAIRRQTQYWAEWRQLMKSNRAQVSTERHMPSYQQPRQQQQNPYLQRQGQQQVTLQSHGQFSSNTHHGPALQANQDRHNTSQPNPRMPMQPPTKTPSHSASATPVSDRMDISTLMMGMNTGQTQPDPPFLRHPKSVSNLKPKRSFFGRMF